MLLAHGHRASSRVRQTEEEIWRCPSNKQWTCENPASPWASPWR